MEFVEFSI